MEKRVWLGYLCGGGEDGWRRERSWEPGAEHKYKASCSHASTNVVDWEWCCSTTTAGSDNRKGLSSARIYGELQQQPDVADHHGSPRYVP
jgi:hypothetical protein